MNEIESATLRRPMLGSEIKAVHSEPEHFQFQRFSHKADGSASPASSGERLSHVYRFGGGDSDSDETVHGAKNVLGGNGAISMARPRWASQRLRVSRSSPRCAAMFSI
jgi:hypothetical protein